MYATNQFEAKILNLMRGQSITGLSTAYLALFLSNPTESGTAGTEVSYTGYTRMPISLSVPGMLNGYIGVQSLQDVTFPISPSAAGNVTHIAIMDSLTGGSIYVYADLTEMLTITANEAPVIVAGEAQFWLTGNISNAYKTIAFNVLRGTNAVGVAPYLALFSGDPENGGAELSGGGYGRIALTFSAPAEQPSGQTEISNSERVTTARATTPWGTWTHTAIYDAAANGTPAWYKQRTSPKEMRKGLLAAVEVGGLTLAVN